MALKIHKKRLAAAINLRRFAIGAANKSRGMLLILLKFHEERFDANLRLHLG